MNPFEYKQFYHRNRPHIHPPDRTLFITFRLAGSIPQALVRQYKAEKLLREKELELIKAKTQTDSADRQIIEFHRNWFHKFDGTLDRAESGPMWLSDPEIRKTVYNKFLEDDGVKYRLDAFCLMSNHAHVVFKPNLGVSNLHQEMTSRGITLVSEESTLAEIMQSIKGVTARKCNLILKRSGSFWEKESFDHVIRGDDGFARAVRYTLNNPVKAKLVSNWRAWPGNYLAPRLEGYEWIP